MTTATATATATATVAARSAQPYITPPNSQTAPYAAQPFAHPDCTTSPPANTSPTSLRSADMLPVATRQLRPPKSPLYTPAVLRPTKREHRPSPLTPPRSLHGSTESLNKTDMPKSPTGPAADDDAAADADDAVPAALLPDVTGPPTREHWKADADAALCDAPVCSKAFSIFERRHHCRHCGRIFCAADSAHTVPLDQDAAFHPAGTVSRACEHCWAQYHRWNRTRATSTDTTADTAADTAADAAPVPAVPVIGVPRARQAAEPKSPVAASVPRDWNWSSF